MVWQLEDGSEFKKLPEIKPAAAKVPDQVSADDKPAEAKLPKSVVVPLEDEVARTVISCAAEAYGIPEEELTLATDIREDLSNESMKMIVMISQIEDELDVEIEIQEASLLNTLEDFTNKVKEKMIQ